MNPGFKKTVCLRDKNFDHVPDENEFFIWDRVNLKHGETVFTDKCIASDDSIGNIVWLMEPRAIIYPLYEHVYHNHSHFKEVWTFDKKLLDLNAKFPGRIKFVYASPAWIKTEEQQIYKKTKMHSIIASNKNTLLGHWIRHKIVERYRGFMDVYGDAYNPIENKLSGLKDYMFQFAIENSQDDFYFTEKLLDCLLTGTVPIYWGCPSIGKFFNTKGFVIINGDSSMANAIKNLTEKDYDSRVPYIRENFERAKKFCNQNEWLYRNVLT
jgi:hypothetical protein